MRENLARQFVENSHYVNTEKAEAFAAISRTSSPQVNNMNPTKLMIGSLLLTVLSLGMVPSATAAGTHICDVDYACLCVDAEGGPECEDDSRASFSSEINYGPVDEKVCISTSNPICSIGPILPGGGN